MRSDTQDFRRELLAETDAANGALDRNDRLVAAVHFARVAELLFLRVPMCIRVEEKLELSRRAKSFLSMAASLDGRLVDSPATDGQGTGEAEPSEAVADHQRGPRLRTGINFEDIAGLRDVKETLRLRVIYPMQHPQKLAEYGLEMGAGMLLFGPPGTGKTMVAKAVAGELDLPFFSLKPSDILSQYFGQSEKHLAEFFDEVRTYDAAVVFLDEIDAVGASRSREGTHEVSRRLLNQLLQELDGVHGRPKGLLFLAATNEPWLLDEALLRPPRFTEKCYVRLPDREARHRLIELQLEDLPLADQINIDRWAAETEGYSGADIVSLCGRAKLIPYRESILEGTSRKLCGADFEEAIRRVRPSVSPESVLRYEQFSGN